MKRYLLDTNAFFNIIWDLRKDKDRAKEKFREILEGDCYISKITEIEIISVIGKYARGRTPTKEKCCAMISEDGTICSHIKYNRGSKGWNRKLINDWSKTVKFILEGKDEYFKVKILPVTDSVIQESEKFIHGSLKYNFRSLDSIIAGTAIANSQTNNPLIVVTSDRGLKAGMLNESLIHMDPLTIQL